MFLKRHFLLSNFSSGCLESVLEDGESQVSFRLFELCKAEIARSGDPHKLISSCDVFCDLLQSGDRAAVNKCLVQLAIFLCHKVRLRLCILNV